MGDCRHGDIGRLPSRRPLRPRLEPHDTRTAHRADRPAGEQGDAGTKPHAGRPERCRCVGQCAFDSPRPQHRAALPGRHLRQADVRPAAEPCPDVRVPDRRRPLGRWTRLDPIRYLAGDNNLYRSIGNQPVNTTDPSGLVWPFSTIAGAVIGAVVGGGAQIVSNLVNGRPTFQGVGGAMVGGAVTGAIVGTVGPTGFAATTLTGAGAGFVGSATGNAVNQLYYTGTVNGGQVLQAGVIGAIAGGVGGGVGSWKTGESVSKTIVQYPTDHMLAHSRVMRVIDVITSRPDISREEVIALLMSEGIEPVDAKLLVSFVPEALSYPLLVNWGVSELPKYYTVQKRSGKLVWLPLEAEHYFTAALAWAQDLFNMEPAARPISLDAFWAVVGRSSILDAAIRMRDTYGADSLRGAVCSPIMIKEIITWEEIEESRREQVRKRRWWQFWR